jgi:hypothetical protein
MVSSIYLNKNGLLSYVDKQFSQIMDQEVEQKAKALEYLHVVLKLQFPGFFIPKPKKKMLKTLGGQALTSEKRELITAYTRRLADYQI